MALEVKLVRSLIGRNKRQRDTVRALGLRKINHTVVKEDTPQIRGMIEKVKHLIEVKEV
jgi:large subunit ribosomal protein L30